MKDVPRLASRDLISAMRAASAPVSLAPARMKSRRVNIKTRSCSGDNPKEARRDQRSSIRANRATFDVTAEA